MFGHAGAVIVDHLVEIRTAGIEGAPPRRTFPIPDDRHPEVGSEGGLSGWLAKTRAAAEAAAAHGRGDTIVGVGADKGHARALEAFVDEILGLGPIVCGVDDAVRATRVALAAVASAREARVVPMSEI